MMGLGGSESTVVDAPEKSVDNESSVSACRRLGGCDDCSDPMGAWTRVANDSADDFGRRDGDGGRQRAHSRGST